MYTAATLTHAAEMTLLADNACGTTTATLNMAKIKIRFKIFDKK